MKLTWAAGPTRPMNRTVRVLLRWLVSEPASQSPRGPRFSTPARFDHQGENWTRDAWSLIITTAGTPDAKGQQFATARFLVPDAPHEWLSVGKRFTLFEGKPIAEGLVEEILAD